MRTSISVRVTLDKQAIDRMLHSPSGTVGRDILQRGRRVEGAAKRLAPVDTGRLRSSINTRLSSSGGELVAIVGTNVKYARIIHDGRGPVFPVRAKVLVFRPKGGRGLVFTKRSRAVAPNPFLLNALPAAVR